MGGKQSGGGKGTGSWSAVHDGRSRCDDCHGLPAGDAKAGLRSIGGATMFIIGRGRYNRRSPNALSVKRDTPQYPPRSGERIYLMCCHVHDSMPKERTSSSRLRPSRASQIIIRQSTQSAVKIAVRRPIDALTSRRGGGEKRIAGVENERELCLALYHRECVLLALPTGGN